MPATEALSFEKVWAMFQEDREQMRQDRERSKEDWERSMKEWEHIKEQMKETDRKIGELGNRFGELAEHLVAPSIKEKFNELGFTFERIYQNLEITNLEGRFLAEIDLMLENGDIVIAVEVKSKPKQEDVDIHAKRMEILRSRADIRSDTRKFRGAIAGAIMSDELRNYSHKAGFYVIEQTGDTVRINIPEDFKPREW